MPITFRPLCGGREIELRHSIKTQMMNRNTKDENSQVSPADVKRHVSRRIFKIQLKVQGEWVGNREFNSIAELVRYANNYHGYSLDYNRIKYHLNRYKGHQFDRKCGEWQTRLLAVG